MGYRSEVVIYVRHPEAKARLIMASIDCDLLKDPVVSDEAYNDEYDVTDEYVRVQWGAIKWYDRYEDIQKAQKFIDDYIALIGDDKSDGDYAACFARIGEEREDVVLEGAGDYYDNVEIYRSFNVTL